ncbi:hypothetical protein MTR_1g040375 [Medicago truncatula]|uniref:Uncharacterized protein n=1 Tax=Medicago truncatula TaxID=3880 RepID=A0A072VG43_MEDTR|nr:hypothetical protein MTR_1g040375 [Medicago truncatula]
MEERIYGARANLPGLFSNLYFQEASLDCIFSMTKRKILLLALTMRIGKPKYLLSETVLLMPEIERRTSYAKRRLDNLGLLLDMWIGS